MKVSLSYARSLYRWRRQAARMIVDACWLMSPTEQAYAATCRAVESGRPFDVAKARAHCEAMILEADALDDERVVFMDWTRARGRGPEVHDRGAFMRSCAGCADRAARGIVSEVSVSYVCTVDMTPGVTDCGREYIGLAKDVRQIGVTAIACTECGGSSMRRGGWPGNLAREYVSEQRSRRWCSRKDCHGGRVGECADCLGHGFMTRYVGEGSLAGVDVPGPGFSVGLRIDCDACEGTGRNRCHECNPIKVVGIRERRPSHAFANGGNLRPAAQRLLDTLDGRCPWNSAAEAQPSECTHCAYSLHSDGERQWATRGRGWIDAGVLRSDANVPFDRVPGIQVRLRECPVCNGTGDNPRGVLPALWPGFAPRSLRGLGFRADRHPATPVEHDDGDRVE